MANSHRKGQIVILNGLEQRLRAAILAQKWPQNQKSHFRANYPIFSEYRGKFPSQMMRRTFLDSCVFFVGAIFKPREAIFTFGRITKFPKWGSMRFLEKLDHVEKCFSKRLTLVIWVWEKIWKGVLVEKRQGNKNGFLYFFCGSHS